MDYSSVSRTAVAVLPAWQRCGVARQWVEVDKALFLICSEKHIGNLGFHSDQVL